MRWFSKIYSREIVPLRFGAISLLFTYLSLQIGLADREHSHKLYQDKIIPFLREHCLDCHGESKAKAGLRLDQLEPNFLEVKTADRWKEVMDIINIGDMPPEDEPRPDPQEAFTLVEWISEELHHAEKVAALQGGRIPARRLNKSEYANTIRDLLKLDQNFVDLIEEDLPADGKGEGFDRLGAALFFDETQLSTYIALAERVAVKAIVEETPPAKQILQWEPELDMEDFESLALFTEISGVEGHEVDSGPAAFIKRDQNVEWIYGIDTRDSESSDSQWMRMAWLCPDLREVVTEPAWYRIRVRAGATRGQRGQPIRMKLHYADGTPMHAEAELTIQAPLNQPDWTEVALFLRPLPKGAEQARLEPYWNPRKDLIEFSPAYVRLRNQIFELLEQIETASDKKVPSEEIGTLRKKLTSLRKEALKFSDSIHQFKPGIDLSTVPRLLVDSIEVSGPFISEKSATTKPKTKLVRMEMEDKWRPHSKTHEVIQYQKDTRIPSGPEFTRRHEQGVEFIQPFRYGSKKSFGHVGHIYYSMLKKDSVPDDGYYRLRIRAGAIQGSRDVPVKIQWIYGYNTPIQQMGELEISGTFDSPEILETEVFLKKMPGDNKPQLRFMWNGPMDLIIENPELREVNLARIRAMSKVRKLKEENAPESAIAEANSELENRIEDCRAFALREDAVAKVFHPERDVATSPRLFIDWIEFEGPYEKEWPPASHQLLFPSGISVHQQGLRDFFSRLLPRAFRRSVSEWEINHLSAATHAAQVQFGLNPVETMRYALQTVLTSPEFLMLIEPSQSVDMTGKINDFELASRLSYFLWSSLPDESLMQFASKGVLSDPSILRQEITRMITDSKSREFVENFVGQWMHVRDFGSVIPAKDYKDYDDLLKQSEIEEPYAFFEEILRNNLRITNFLKSDFLMVNERLARFYGIQGVQGKAFRRVALNPEIQRGGILSMAGLLTYLSDGTRTLPVRRGAWILEQIFNDPPPPPPPSAGEIQPNVKGQNLSVRQRLEQHRNEATCASCHQKIDPLGLALENYDAIGAWRDRQNGEGFRYHKAPPINSSGEYQGVSFTTPNEFKEALLKDKDRFVRAFCEKMLTYALGRPVSYFDQQTIEALMQSLRENDDRIQNLLFAIVQSEVFQSR